MKQVLCVLTLLLAASGLAARAQDYPADNSGKNMRDRSDAAKTAGDQSNASADVTITQRIRKAVTADKSLSTNAHNVKIITNEGMVTLRGPVRSAKEKEVIGAKAQRIAGVRHVDNQLEIASH